MVSQPAHSAVGRRAHELVQELNAFNNGLGIAYLHLLIKYFEFGLLRGPYKDGYRVKGRGKLHSALDLCINSRMVGLNLDLDKGTIGTVKPLRPAKGRRGSVNGYEEHQDTDGSVKVDGKTRPVHVEAWLPRPNHQIQRTKVQAVKRHFLLGLRSLWVIDFLLTLERYVASTTLGNPHGTPHAVETFVHSNTILLFPETSLEFPCPTLLTETVITISVGTTVWQGLVGGYHMFAVGALCMGWEVEAWEVDLMNQPWKSDSLLDIWGRRWHQLFRVSPLSLSMMPAIKLMKKHQFLLIANCILHPLGLAQNSTATTTMVFILSAIYHSLGELSMHPAPAVGPLSGFFLLSGVGCGLEVTFKRLTGRKVAGWQGRIWTWAFLLTTGRWACSSWLDSGLAGSNLGFPGPGRWLVPVIAENLFKVVPK
jgi:hypothetical protein